MSTSGIDYILDPQRFFCTRTCRQRKRDYVNQLRYICMARDSDFCTCNRLTSLGWRLLRIPLGYNQRHNLRMKVLYSRQDKNTLQLRPRELYLCCIFQRCPKIRKII
ncbi:hypothetical protein PUN28_018587 [Cardiocondyla obscurior]|uniref:Uncharacterized protein n=1 Tax=Cardiocondyla obscurior TaxID=286306 RepID=A0AAW2EGV9_9HYME